MIDLRGKNIAVFGVANKSSLAWAITETLVAAGATVQVVCQEEMHKRVLPLTENLKLLPPLFYDALKPDTADICFAKLAQRGNLHGLVHSIAFSGRAQLSGRFLDVTADNFANTMHVSCYSLIDLARRAAPLMQEGGSILTLTFDASRGSYPHYNVMGLAKAALESAVNYAATDLGEYNIRVNGIAASPEDTLSARGIGNFRLIGEFASAMSPLSRRATPEEIANEAVYLLSPLSSGVTGQIRFVDCGSSVPKMPPVRNAALMASAMTKIHEVHMQQNAKKATDT